VTRSSYASALWVVAGLCGGVILGILASVSASPWLLALVRFVEPVGTIFVNAILSATLLPRPCDLTYANLPGHLATCSPV